MGLEVGDDVHRDLTLISKVFDQYTSVAWKTVLEGLLVLSMLSFVYFINRCFLFLLLLALVSDTVEVLDWHRSKLKFAYSSVSDISLLLYSLLYVCAAG